MPHSVDQIDQMHARSNRQHCCSRMLYSSINHPLSGSDLRLATRSRPQRPRRPYVVSQILSLSGSLKNCPSSARFAPASPSIQLISCGESGSPTHILHNRKSENTHDHPSRYHHDYHQLSTSLIKILAGGECGQGLGLDPGKADPPQRELQDRRLQATACAAASRASCIHSLTISSHNPSISHRSFAGQLYPLKYILRVTVSSSRAGLQLTNTHSLNLSSH